MKKNITARKYGRYSGGVDGRAFLLCMFVLRDYKNIFIKIAEVLHVIINYTG
jgi:hypothetical protein